ncbi:MAG: cell division FtsZ family protein [Tannerella sp.]|jgi:cell division protein FtsZ|nr:cell division FtsZ family protein [Tannerella sp.]
MDTNVGMNFSFPTDPTKIIKVIGIGGGGVNSVNHMFECGIHGVNFAVCNTDEQSFDGVNVPIKVTLGAGLGAGGRPEKAKEEFEKSAAEVKKLLEDGTKMVFIAAGMGGGTGSGAAPLLAKMAKDKGILTVGIVTIPFLYEKVPRIVQALDAVEEMSKNVDALIVINNERLKMFYPDFDLVEAFKKPNEVLAMAVKSIAEIITVKGIINRDFNDVTSTMKNSGVALVSYGFGYGENRLDNAIQDALDSPLLNNNDIYNAKRILFYISFKKDAHFKVDELTKSIDNFMGRFDNHIEMIWGFGVDESLGVDQEVKFTIIATGFGLDAVPEIREMKDENELLRLQDDIEKRKKNEERVKGVYGENLNTNIKVNRVSQSSIVVLTMDEMDDDTLINFLENNPTYNRNPKEIAKVRKPAKGTGYKEEHTSSPGNRESGGVTLIEF